MKGSNKSQIPTPTQHIIIFQNTKVQKRFLKLLGMREGNFERSKISYLNSH